MDMTSIGRNIRRYRNEKKIMQETLAEKTDLSANYIGMIERGEKVPSLSSLIAIANALGVTADMLLCDVLTESYEVKSSVLLDKVSELPKTEQERIFAVIETMIKYAE
ncbi:helix-turn-helix transcriptional regulator [Ruminococcus sp.]|uniref:helix-turn-helix domain-containing protein n=1 Tax=Ruminococcus sp. TaxID=41978 RepID=UPI001B25FCA2|nr:helix-turn-helix transcriptional regulator [Ruminococcus sp.]MBO5559100.1 helix-turn-helix transcriptional regulator [Ruminococcus sp.]